MKKGAKHARVSCFPIVLKHLIARQLISFALRQKLRNNQHVETKVKFSSTIEREKDGCKYCNSLCGENHRFHAGCRQCHRRSLT